MNSVLQNFFVILPSILRHVNLFIHLSHTKHSCFIFVYRTVLSIKYVVSHSDVEKLIDMGYWKKSSWTNFVIKKMQVVNGISKWNFLRTLNFSVHGEDNIGCIVVKRIFYLNTFQHTLYTLCFLHKIVLKMKYLPTYVCTQFKI